MEMTSSESARPLFGNAFRILHFRRQALDRRTPWALRDAARELEMSTKTIKRYVQFLGLLDTDGFGRPLLEFVRQGGRVYIQARDRRRRREDAG